ncbi:MAG TPA: NUDIX hydrolase [Isosphaeraceae bacterium]|jgi:8-oxo-dGTP pyrophosphatase MutT (NUDIX family)|nr:NUDIX hydrolase [Isosphaeraceae bacterium]
MPADESNPWQTLARRLVYDNPWITVHEDRVIRPDGQEGIYGVVHYKNRAIGVLPVDDQGRIWLVGQYRYTLDRYSWEIPEGGAPEGEPAEDAARRELREETGLSAAHLEPIARAHLSNSVSDEEAIIFRATGLTAGTSQPEGTERLRVRLFEWCEAWGMLSRGEITDSMTVIALLQEAVRRSG